MISDAPTKPKITKLNVQEVNICIPVSLDK